MRHSVIATDLLRGNRPACAAARVNRGVCRAQLALRADDARAALERVGEDHPFRWRIEALVPELE